MARFSSQKVKILAVVKLMHLANISRDRYMIMINYILTSLATMREKYVMATGYFHLIRIYAFFFLKLYGYTRKMNAFSFGL